MGFSTNKTKKEKNSVLRSCFTVSKTSIEKSTIININVIESRNNLNPKRLLLYFRFSCNRISSQREWIFKSMFIVSKRCR